MKLDKVGETKTRLGSSQIVAYPEVNYHGVTLYVGGVVYKLCSGAAILTRLQGSMGETKLKILAIIHYHNVLHGYGIWRALKENFHIYLDEQNRRNVYHHLHDLNSLGLVKSRATQLSEGSLRTNPYSLTEEGKKLEEKFGKYLNFL